MGRCVETGSAETAATIYYAGDSTVQFNSIDSYPQTGLGQVLPRFVKEIYPVSNHGKNGRSTKSFIDEGRLAQIYNRIKEGDFLFIQFGHNDEKREDETRFTDPYGEYADNLEKFIDVARNKKAYPVLITPIERNHFENGRLYAGKHAEYVSSMKQVAVKTGVPLIDLYTATRNIMDEIGENAAKSLYVADGTHMTQEGAVRYCYEIARELCRLGGVYKELLIDEVEFNENTCVMRA